MDIRAFKTPQDCSLKNVYLPRHASEVCSCNMCKLALVVHEDLRNSSSCEGKADGPSNHQVSTGFASLYALRVFAFGALEGRANSLGDFA